MSTPEPTQGEPTAQPPPPPSSPTKRNVLLVVILAIAILLVFYFKGSFDRPLYSIGLNFKECARNGFGATFCGKELDEYRQRVEAAKQKLTQAKETIEANQRKSSEQAREREAEVRSNARARRAERERELVAKLKQEQAIEEREPEGSVAYDLAKGEYEATRAEAQQLLVEVKSEEGKTGG